MTYANSDTDKTIIETIIHIYRVQKLLALSISELQERLINHDKSKILSDELEGFTKSGKKLSEMEYGSQEYWNNLERMKETLEHHYKLNPHHPQHFKNGINDMTLIDLLEMTCDWIASAERSKNGNVMISLHVQKDRFKIEEQLYQILKNTIYLLEAK
jgi:hypothetical protein